MKYIYTYQTKNILNGKTYIGVHSTNKLNDGYIGCGIRSESSCRSQIKAGRNYSFINAVSKYGYKNFKKEILSFYENIEEAYEDESFMVNKDYILKKDNYNVCLGGMFSVKLKKLEQFKEDINKMFSNINISYEQISKKYNTTKGSWISLITDDSILKRKESIKKNKNTGLKVENIKGDVFELKDLNSFKIQTGLCSKSIHKLIKSGYSKKWYLCGSEKLIKKRKEIEGAYITLKDKKVFLKEIYECGVSNFAINNKINLSTLEVSLRKAKK